MKSALMLLPLAILASCSLSRPSKKAVSFNDYMKRESTGLTNQKVHSKDDLLTFSVKAKVLPKVQLIPQNMNGYYYASIDMGASAPLECFFYSSELSPASTLKIMTEKALSDQKVAENVVEKEIALFGAGNIGPIPYLVLNTNFLTKDKKAGHFKSMIAIKDTTTLFCIHNEVGYLKTFVERFAEVAVSYDFTSMPKLNPLFNDVTILTVQDIPVGFVVNYLVDKTINSKLWIQKASLMIPQSKINISAHDMSDVEVSSLEGTLVYGKYKAESSGKLDYLIDLSTEEEKKYFIKGIFHGKEISETLKTNGLISNYGHTKLVSQNLFQNHLQHFSIMTYTPSTDPHKAMSLKTSLKKLHPDGASVTMASGNDSKDIEVDLDGTIKEISTLLGPVTMKGKRAFKFGAVK